MARFPDASAYLLGARTLAETGAYPLRTDPHYFRPPAYPLFLVAVTLGHPDRIAVAKTANAVLGSLAVLLLAAISLRLFRSRPVAIAAGLVAALDPSLVLASGDIQSEPLFLALLLSAGFFLLVTVDRPSSNYGVLAGALLGLSALTRPSALALIPLLAAPLADRRYPLRARMHLAGSAFLGLVLSLSPWTLRNALVFRTFMPVSDIGGLNFAIGNSDRILELCALKDRAAYGVWGSETASWAARRLEQLRSEGIESHAGISRALVRRTLQERLADPSGTAKLLVCKASEWLRPYPNPAFWPLPVVLGVGAFYVTLFVLAAIGLATAPRRGVSLFAIALLLVTMAAHVLTISAWRYRAPYWDPVLILYGVFGAWRSRSEERE